MSGPSRAHQEWGARPPTCYLCYSVQAAEGGLQVLILFCAEAGELEVLGGTRKQKTAQDYRLFCDRVLSPTRKGPCVKTLGGIRK